MGSLRLCPEVSGRRGHCSGHCGDAAVVYVASMVPSWDQGFSMMHTPVV